MPDPTTTNIGTLQANEPDMTAEEIAAMAPDKPLVEGAVAAVVDPAAAPAAAAVVEPAAVVDPAAAAAVVDPAAAPTPAAAAAVAEVPTPAPASTPPVVPFAPTYSGTGRDFAAELAAVDKAREDLREKYKANGMDDDEYDREFERLNEVRADLRLDQRSEQIKIDLSQQNQDQSWAYLQNQWLTRPENALIQSSPPHFSAWESAMQQVVNEAAVAGKAQPGDWDLMEGARAKLVTVGILGAAPPAATPAAAAAAVGGAGERPAQRAAAFSDVPATLSSVPSAADPGARSTVDDLATVGIEDLEDRFAGYTDAQRDALLRQVPGAASFEVN